MSEQKLIISPFDSKEEIENKLLNSSSDVTPEFVESLFSIFLSDEYMAKFGYIYDPEKNVYTKKSLELEDLKYFLKILESDLANQRSPIRSIKRLSVLLDSMIVYRNARQSTTTE